MVDVGIGVTFPAPSWGQELTVRNATWTKDGAAVNLEIVVSGKGEYGYEYQPQFVLRETRKAQSYEVKPVQSRRWMSSNDSNNPRTLTVPLPSAMAGRADLQNVEIVVSCDPSLLDSVQSNVLQGLPFQRLETR